LAVGGLGRAGLSRILRVERCRFQTSLLSGGARTLRRSRAFRCARLLVSAFFSGSGSRDDAASPAATYAKKRGAICVVWHQIEDTTRFFVVEANITRFKKQIAAETDESMRKVLAGLLEKEEVKLNKLLDGG
jgi:hypothetical protein